MTVTGQAGRSASPPSVAVRGPWPQPMDNPVRDYEWGSTTALARLQGRPGTGRPEAELWMGAHPSAPSTIGGTGLDVLVAEQGPELLGADVHDRFGDRLPFLLKILAISRPLSLQVHPTADRARTAFEDEAHVLGEHRYVDPYPKPELLYALETVDALCGFRPAAQAHELLGLVGGERLAGLAAPLAGEGDETARLEKTFELLVTWPDADRAGFVAEVAAAAHRLLETAGPLNEDGPLREGDLDAPARRALTWAARLAEQHPRDPLVAAPFVLDLVRLLPGETLFVPAGAPHAYLHGLGVEIMGNSDNVLRAGLTHKPIAVEELLHIVQGGSRPVRDLPAEPVGPAEVIWTPGVPEFRLSRLSLTDAAPVHAWSGVTGPQIVLVTAGTVRVGCAGHEVELTPGRSAFVGADAGPLTLSGPGEVFRAFAGAA